MRIKYIPSKNERFKSYDFFIEKNFPQFVVEGSPDIFLVAGGDGAMLHAMYDTVDVGIPYLGRAMGTLNFLMNGFDDDVRILNGILDGSISLDVVDSYAIDVSLDGEKLGESVNDVILGDGISDYFSFSLSTGNGDFENFELKGSGLCISTAIGSTAFNFNNGGRILPLDSCLLSITGVVCNRYLNDIIPFNEVRIRSNGCKVFLTNVESKVLGEGSELLLRKGSKVQLAFLDKKEFERKRIEMGHRFRK